jgi:toxin CcdB
MAQFDVHRNGRNKRYPLLLDLQADLLRDLATRVVAPMTPAKKLGGKPIGRLNPIVTVNSAEYVIVLQELAAVPVAALGAKVISLRKERNELIGAIDLLFTGV